MKTNKYTYYLQNIVITLLFITAFSSCQFEELAVDCEEKGVIVLNLGLDKMNTRATGDTEETVSTVRIFVFSGDVLEKNSLFTNSTDFANPIRLEVIIGDKEIYVVANESSELTSKLTAVNTKSDLFSIAADDITSQLTMPFVMTGSGSASVSGITNTTIYLKRVAAKISLQLKKSSENETDVVEIYKVSLNSNTSKSTLFPSPPSTALTLSSGDYWNLNYELPAPLALTTASQAIGNLYVYENLGNSSDDKEVATQLEIKAKYNNIDTKYSVYINESISSPGTGNPGDPDSSVIDDVEDHFYNIWRNYHYQLIGTISGIGDYTSISVEVKILPWTIHEYAVPLE